MSLNTPEIRSFGAAPTLTADGNQIEGLAAVYYDPAKPETEYVYRMVNPANPKGDPIEVRERIFPGAFTRAIAEDEVICFYNHEHNIGRRIAGDPKNTMELWDDGGLRYRTKLPQHMYGQLVKEAIERGDLRGSSFKFVPRAGGVTWRQEKQGLVRELRDLQLFDASPVDEPAYKGTSVGLRSELRAEERAAIEAVLTPPAEALPDPQTADQIRALQMQIRLMECRTDATSFDSITEQLYRLLSRATGRDYLWPTAVYETFCIYQMGSPPVMYQQGYTTDESGTVSLVGDPVKVKKTEAYEPA